MIQASDGALYGTTPGTVFKITTTGVFTTLHSFDCSTEGCGLMAALMEGSNGALYGTTTTSLIDTNHGGTVFQITTAGVLTTLHSFNCVPDGCNSVAGLIQASDGNLYGTASVGGPRGGGVVFQIAPTLIARVWVGLKNSDDVGLRLDLLAQVYADGTKVGEGQLRNASGRSSGFNNAMLLNVPLAFTSESASFPFSTALTLRLGVRRTCSGGGHSSGTLRLWYGGQPIDSGARRDAGSRFDANTDDASTDYFLRSGFVLSTTPGTSKQFVDVSVDSREACPSRPFRPFGTWSVVP